MTVNLFIILVGGNKMKNSKELDIKILEAIQLIASNTDAQISYDVKHIVDKQPFSKQGVNITSININLKHL